MKMKSMITGVSMAIAAGTVAYAVTEATSSEKKMLKKPHRTCYQSYR